MMKILLATAILALGIAGAFFVVQGTHPATVSDTALDTQNNNITTSGPFVEKLTGNLAASIDQKENLTETLTRDIAQKIADSNPNGPKEENGQRSIGVPDANALAQDAIKEAVKKFDASKLSPVVQDSDITISTDNSRTAILAYITQVQNTLDEEGQSIPDGVISNTPSLDQIPALLTMYKDTINKFYALSVPPDAVAMHKKEIALLLRKAYILSAMGNYANDPVTTLLVAPELEKVGADFTAFSAEFSAFTKKYSA